MSFLRDRALTWSPPAVPGNGCASRWVSAPSVPEAMVPLQCMGDGCRGRHDRWQRGAVGCHTSPGARVPLINPSSWPGAVLSASPKWRLRANTRVRRHGRQVASDVQGCRRPDRGCRLDRTCRGVGCVGAIERPEEGRSMCQPELHALFGRSFIRRIACGLQSVNGHQLGLRWQPQLASPSAAWRCCDCALQPLGSCGNRDS